jgi:TRAP transporter TAXI family solute receptor
MKGEEMMKRAMNSKFLLVMVISSLMIFGMSQLVSAGKTIPVSISSAGLGGTWYPLSAGIANALTKHIPDVSASAETSGGSIENIAFLVSGQAEMACAEHAAVFFAMNSERMFKGKPPAKNLRHLFSVDSNIWHTTVLKKSGINNISDLKGKKVLVGVPGSTTQVGFELLLQEFGMTFKDIKPQYGTFLQGVNWLKDGIVDAIHVDAAPPVSSIIDLDSMHDIVILSYEQDKIASLHKKYPYIAPSIIPANTYKGVPTETRTVGVSWGYYTRAELSDELVYNMAKAIFENLKEISAVHPRAKNINLNNVGFGKVAPFHPGAEKYYREVGAIK